MEISQIFRFKSYMSLLIDTIYIVMCSKVIKSLINACLSQNETEYDRNN